MEKKFTNIFQIICLIICYYKVEASLNFLLNEQLANTVHMIAQRDPNLFQFSNHLLQIQQQIQSKKDQNQLYDVIRLYLSEQDQQALHEKLEQEVFDYLKMQLSEVDDFEFLDLTNLNEKKMVKYQESNFFFGNFVRWLKCLFRDCATEDQQLDHDQAEKQRMEENKKKEEERRQKELQEQQRLTQQKNQEKQNKIKQEQQNKQNKEQKSNDKKSKNQEIKNDNHTGHDTKFNKQNSSKKENTTQSQKDEKNKQQRASFVQKQDQIQNKQFLDKIPNQFINTEKSEFEENINKAEINKKHLKDQFQSDIENRNKLVNNLQKQRDAGIQNPFEQKRASISQIISKKMNVKDDLVKELIDKSNLDIIQDLDNQNYYDGILNNGLGQKAKIQKQNELEIQKQKFSIRMINKILKKGRRKNKNVLKAINKGEFEDYINSVSKYIAMSDNDEGFLKNQQHLSSHGNNLA